MGRDRGELMSLDENLMDAGVVDWEPTEGADERES